MFVFPLIKVACHRKDLMVLIGMSLRNGGIIISFQFSWMDFTLTLTL